MKTIAKLLAVELLVICSASALAEVHYVDVNSTNATPPYLVKSVQRVKGIEPSCQLVVQSGIDFLSSATDEVEFLRWFRQRRPSSFG